MNPPKKILLLQWGSVIRTCLGFEWLKVGSKMVLTNQKPDVYNTQFLNSWISDPHCRYARKSPPPKKKKCLAVPEDEE